MVNAVNDMSVWIAPPSEPAPSDGCPENCIDNDDDGPRTTVWSGSAARGCSAPSPKAPADHDNDKMVHRSAAAAASAVWRILAEDSSAARRTLQAADFVEELLDLAEALGPVTNSRGTAASSSASEITSGAVDAESSQNSDERERRRIGSPGAVYGPVDDEKSDEAVAVGKAAALAQSDEFPPWCRPCSVVRALVL